MGGLHHGEGVDAVSAVDVGDFAGDAGGEVGEQEGGGIAHFFDGYVAAEGVLVGNVFEQFAQIGDARGGQCLNRTGGDAVAADAVAAAEEAVKRMAASRLALAKPMTL